MVEYMNSYLRNIILKLSTLDGALFVAAGLAYLIFHPVAAYVAWSAMAYGIYKILVAK